jgi:hypothetical protein
MKTEKEKKRIKDPHRVKNVANSDIGKVVTNVLTMEQRKGKWFVPCLYFPIDALNSLLMLLLSCRKRKLRKNNTKGWFPAEVSTPNSDPCQDTPTKQPTIKKRGRN